MVSRESLVPIPHPRPKPLIGNILELSATAPIADLVNLARELGPIYQLDMMGKPFTVVSGFDLVDECCDEKRFDKSVRGNLRKIREIGGDALFTAYTSEPNWSKAHNILLPNFGDRAMASYHPAMLDIVGQLMLKWSRLNADDEIDVVHDMTALTLDTIGLTGFGYRFNSLYRRDFHPFVDKMVDSLEIAMAEKGFPFEEVLAKPRQKRMDANAAFMFDLVDRLIAERKEERARTRDETKHDLLDYMLAGVDKKTGSKLDDTNIRFQIITFLIAGHETTSGMLSFALYYLLNNPDVLEKAYAEVDRVFGTDVSVEPTLRQVNALQYISQILKESLRLWPTAPAFAVYPYEDEIVGGKYELKKRSQVVLLLPALHRDVKVWGPRAAVFDPDNFAPEAEAARPVNAYKPFGNGQRACIGRQFALQEAALVVGMMLQRFRLIDHERYVLRVREALTVKPEGFKIKVRERVHKRVAVASPSPAATGGNGSAAPAVATANVPKHGTPLLVLFGSNLGTAEDVAHQLADAGDAQGFATSVGWLDDFVGKLPTDGALAIVCASYNGAPPDNAAGFVKWLQEERAGSLAGVKYAVFGCGNRNWASTYQNVPRLIDERLAAHGAQRIFARGEGDARDDLDGDFRTWRAAYVPELARAFGVSFDDAAQTAAKPQYEIRVVESPEPNPLAAQHGATEMRVALNRELQAAGSPRSTRHLDIALPAGGAYRAGDHLGVVAPNPPGVVQRVCRRFDFSPNTYVVLAPTGPRTSSLPIGKPIALRQLLGDYVELQHVATRSQLQTLADHTRCPKTRPQLLALASDENDGARYKAEVKAKRRSVLDILEDHPACEVPLEAYLDMLPLMTPRYYSISSSPLAQAERCSITVGVIAGPAQSGHGTFEGVCSTFLRRCGDGSTVHAFVKESKSGFALPDDPARPIVMIGPGTGLAPFRGFLQEREMLAIRGTTLGPAMLFFGCRNAGEDYIYRDELEAFAARGLVELHVAFSRAGTEKRYVQHDIAERADAVWALLEAGAHVYVCGDGSKMEPDVRATLVDLHARKTGAGTTASTAWIGELMTQGRYNLDVWANA